MGMLKHQENRSFQRFIVPFEETFGSNIDVKGNCGENSGEKKKRQRECHVMIE